MKNCGDRHGLSVSIKHLENPRVELEEHYYNAAHSKLTDLGLQPNLLTEDVISSMIEAVQENKDNVNPDLIQPRIKWALKER